MTEKRDFINADKSKRTCLEKTGIGWHNVSKSLIKALPKGWLYNGNDSKQLNYTLTWFCAKRVPALDFLNSDQQE